MFRRVVAFLIILGLLPAALCSLYWPMGRDQGIFAWAGTVILNGGIPYRDVWDVKGPAAFYTFAVAIRLFGANEWGIRVLDAGILLLSMPVLWILARRIAGTMAGWLAVAFYLVWYWSQGYWCTAQPDGWIALLELFMMGLLIHGNRSPRLPTYFWAGILVGLTMLYKAPFGAYLGAVGVVIWQSRSSIKDRALACAVAVAGLVLPLILTAGWFASRGALGDFFQTQFTFNIAIHSTAHRWKDHDVIHRFIKFWELKRHVIVLAVAIVGSVRLWKLNRRLLKMIATFGAIDLFCIVLQSKFYEYHWEPLFVPLILLEAIGVIAIAEAIDHWQAQRTQKFPNAAMATIFASFLVAYVPLLISLFPWMSAMMGKSPWDTYYGAFIRPSVLSERRVAAYIHDSSQPGDEVLVWGFDPLINYDAARAAPTRFGYHYPLTREPLRELQLRWRQEFLKDMNRRPPLYIVVADHDPNNLTPRTSKEYLELFPQFEQWMLQAYSPVELGVNDYHLWRRKAVVSPTVATTLEAD